MTRGKKREERVKFGLDEYTDDVPVIDIVPMPDNELGRFQARMEAEYILNRSASATPEYCIKRDQDKRPGDSLSAPQIPSCLQPPTRFEIPKSWKGKVEEVIWDSDKPIAEDMKSGIKRQKGVA